MPPGGNASTLDLVLNIEGKNLMNVFARSSL